MEIGIGTDLHERRQVHHREDSSGGENYTSVANSIPELTGLSKVFLEETGIKDYKVPCLSWVTLQFSHSNTFHNKSIRHTERFNI